MRSAVVLSLAAAVTASLFDKRTGGCEQDNCLRDIQGDHPGLLPVTQRQADCSSFMGATTVFAAQRTTTLTTTVWETISPLTPGQKKRDDVPTVAIPSNSKPTYATMCDNNSQYYAACSCWGITAAATTQTAPLVTETATVTVSLDWCDC